MTAQILDGKATAAAIKAELAERVAALAARASTPGLGTLLVGDDPGSTWYVNGKHADCAEVGIASIREDLPATATQDGDRGGGRAAQRRPRVHGLHRATAAAGRASTPTGCSSWSTPRRTPTASPHQPRPPRRCAWARTSRRPLPCTPKGIIELDRAPRRLPAGRKDIVVIGRGTTVGRSIGLLLTRKAVNATVTLCHTGHGRPRVPHAQRRRHRRRRRRARHRHGRHGQAGRGPHRRRREPRDGPRDGQVQGGRRHRRRGAREGVVVSRRIPEAWAR